MTVALGITRADAGSLDLHVELENAIAEFKHSEAAITFSSGYVTNLTAVSTLVGRHDVVICDKLNHASIVDGCFLSGADFVRFRHNDMDDLERCLRRAEAKATKLVVVDAVIRLLGQANESQRAELVTLLSRSGNHHRQALRPWFERFDAIAYARDKALWYTSRAGAELDRLPPTEARDVLMGLTQFMPSEFYTMGYDLDGDGIGDACECLNVTCTASDQCHDAGACAPTSGGMRLLFAGRRRATSSWTH